MTPNALSIARTPVAHTVVDSPIGPLTVVADAAGALVGLHMAEQRHAPDPASVGERDDTTAPEVVTQLHEYFAGDRVDFDVELRLDGTPFQVATWQALRSIPYGRTTSYGALAATLGRPGASRAVGLANGRNPIAVIVPCHRVIGADGTLTGYGGGLDRKRWLLEHEAARCR